MSRIFARNALRINMLPKIVTSSLIVVDLQSPRIFSINMIGLNRLDIKSHVTTIEHLRKTALDRVHARGPNSQSNQSHNNTNNGSNSKDKEKRVSYANALKNKD